MGGGRLGEGIILTKKIIAGLGEWNIIFNCAR